MREEGIKFYCIWIKQPPVEELHVEDLNKWRDRLYTLGVIGLTNDDIGFGNISIRFGPAAFLISGTGTGRYETLTAAHYTQVTSYSIEENKVVTEGPVRASSESLTHATIYECGKEINAVIHVHHFALWKNLLQKLPATDNKIPYGTPEMAREIERLFRETNVAEDKIFAMGGHEEGVISFGRDLDEAGAVLLHYLEAVL